NLPKTRTARRARQADAQIGRHCAMILAESLKGKWTLRIAIQDEVEVAPIVFCHAKRTCRAARLSLHRVMQTRGGQGMRLKIRDDRLGAEAQAQYHLLQ